jgi:hypothetical protein
MDGKKIVDLNRSKSKKLKNGYKRKLTLYMDPWSTDA